MTKILLSCDEYAYHLNGDFYLGEFGTALVYRYLNVFDKIRVAVRTKDVNIEKELKSNLLKINDDRIEVFPLPFFQGPKQYAKVFFKTREILKEVTDGCDVAIFRLPSTVAYACLSVVKKKNMAYAIEIVANPFELKQSAEGFIYKCLMTSWDNQLKKAALGAKGVSYVTKASLQNNYPASKNGFTTSYSSIELDDLFFFEPRTKVVENQEIKISHVANPIKTFSKGHMTVMKIVKYLNDKNLKASAKFAGDGKLVDEFKQRAVELGIADKIEFVGLLNKQELYEFLLDSNIMVFPSSSEGLPRVIIEAMATGLPCLSTKIGGIPELLDHSLLFDKDDIEGFSQKIIEIFSDKKIYNRLSKSNFEKSKEYSRDVLTKKRNDFYRKLLDEVNK